MGKYTPVKLASILRHNNVMRILMSYPECSSDLEGSQDELLNDIEKYQNMP